MTDYDRSLSQDMAEHHNVGVRVGVRTRRCQGRNGSL